MRKTYNLQLTTYNKFLKLFKEFWVGVVGRMLLVISQRKGQVMLLTVVMIGGLILTSTAIAGLLMVYQIRQATDVEASTKAIFAADAGIECESYHYFKNDGFDCSSLVFNDSLTSVISTYEEVSGGEKITIKGEGQNKKNTRALQVTYTVVLVPQCSDELDNDGDGLKDFGADPLTNDPDCSSIDDLAEAFVPLVP